MLRRRQQSNSATRLGSRPWHQPAGGLTGIFLILNDDSVMDITLAEAIAWYYAAYQMGAGG